MAGLEITIRTENLDRVRETLNKLSGQQARQAYAKALNDTGFQLRRQMQAAIPTRFDRPTKFITNAPKVFLATPDSLTVAVAPTRDTRKLFQPGMQFKAASGVDPQQVLQAEQFGGARRDKRLEVALRALGVLPPGLQVTIPRDDPYPGSDDGRGNITGAFARKLIAYFRSGADLGGMNKRQRSTALKGATFASNLRSRRTVKLMDGREWFAVQPGARLQPGIWTRGPKGDLKPALIFARPGSYQARLQIEQVAKESELQDYLDRRVRYRVREAAGV